MESRRPSTTYLFVPAIDGHKVERALHSGVDTVILDLEDSIVEQLKGEARGAVGRVGATRSPRGGPEIWVRINGEDTPWFAGDLENTDWKTVDGAVLPKAESVSAVRALTQVGVRRVILLIESVAGLVGLSLMVSAVAEVERVALGTWDLALDLGLVTLDDPDESELIWQLRGHLVVESRRLNLLPPIDGVYTRFKDDDGLRAASRRAQHLGFGAKLLIHPRQIPIVRSAFSPDPGAVAFAREVVRVYEDAAMHHEGVVQVRGQAIDRPMVERARAVLKRWGDSGA